VLRADAARRVAVVVTRGDAGTLQAMARACAALAREGAAIRIFFRDESIPSVCRSEARERMLPDALDASQQPAAAADILDGLARAGDVRFYACTSSLYLWGAGSGDLIPQITGPRGLIAFLAEDVAGATEVLSY